MGESNLTPEIAIACPINQVCCCCPPSSMSHPRRLYGHSGWRSAGLFLGFKEKPSFREEQIRRRTEVSAAGRHHFCNRVKSSPSFSGLRSGTPVLGTLGHPKMRFSPCSPQVWRLQTDIPQGPLYSCQKKSKQMARQSSLGGCKSLLSFIWVSSW